jgi:hypothetical protein
MSVRSWSVSLLVLSLPVLAHAEAPAGPVEPPTTVALVAPSPDAPESDEPPPFVSARRELPAARASRFALGVNTPVGWIIGSIGASMYVGLSPHLAIRANFAYYGNENSLEELVNITSDREVHKGRLIDYGAGLVWYPRRRWQGLMLEAGALLRDRAIRNAYDFDVVKNWTLTYAGRGMIGWSWRIGPAFISAAVGLSAGYEVGRETVKREFFSAPMPATTRQLARLQVDAETTLRIGFVFGD